MSNYWTNVVSPQFATITEALGLGFAEDGLTGWTGVGINGQGSEVWKTTDGGQNWTSVWPDPDTKNPANLFLNAASQSRTSVVVTGVADHLYSTDGSKFQASINDFLSPAQDIEVLPNNAGFGLISYSNKFNGVATSKTGMQWTNVDMGLGANSTYYPARYGAFPTASTWYVSAGLFPTSNSEEGFHASFENFGRYTHDASHRFTFDDELDVSSTPNNCADDPTNCYSAGIFKTTDAGQTWTQIYNDINQGSNIYPNDMDCFDANNCIAVLEGETCRIISTTDGGATWTESMHDTDSACSLMYVEMLSATEAWVGGGHLAALNFEGRFWHTTDGAQTWVKEAHKGLYILDLEMNTLYGYALGLDASGAGVTMLSFNPNP